jgi:two-component system cell cycle sensor histidine kinase/response regulator CckA
MTPAGGSAEKILVVEDEKAILEIVTNILSGAGYSVVAASRGEEALRLASEQPGRFDMVLTDIVMPGMSGGELVQQLLISHPDIRILYMSGYTKYTVVSHGVLESVSSFIWKPFSPDELLQKVREVLESPTERS